MKVEQSYFFCQSNLFINIYL